MLTINIITLFPELFESFIAHRPINQAVQQGKLKIKLIQLRDFAIDERGTVDGRPYGGGTGMLLRVEPVWNALKNIYPQGIERAQESANIEIIALTPKGNIFNQQIARELSKKENITLICGRYEGMDARIYQKIATKNISLGRFVLSGGEIPALAIMESVTRLIPGVIEKPEAIEIESYAKNLEQIEFPQYTRPDNFNGWKVPDMLKSGDHQAIAKFREAHTTRRKIKERQDDLME